MPAIKIGGQECPKHTLPQLSSGPLGGGSLRIEKHVRTRYFLFAILLYSSCKDTGVQPTTPISTFPLKVGNQWNFQQVNFDTLGNTSWSQSDSIRIIGDTIIAGDRWYYYNYHGHLLSFRNSESGVLARLVSPNTDGIAKLYLKFPAHVGDSYGFPIVGFSGFNAWLDTAVQCTVMSLDTVVTVALGTFHCYQFRVGTSNTWWDNFVSQDYGWISEELYSNIRIGGNIFHLRSSQTVKLRIL